MANDQNQKCYTLKEAATKLHFSYNKLHQYKKAGLLNITKFYSNNNYKLKSGPKTHGITEAELNRIKKLIQPPKDGLTMNQFAKKTHLSPEYVRSLVIKLNLKPMFANNNHVITPNKNYYHKDELAKITKHLYHRNLQAKYLNIEQTTSIYYNPEIHYTISDLGIILNEQKPVSSAVISRWVNTKRIPYNIDPNGKLYFTKNEVQYIKDKYHHLPDNLYGNHQKLADALFVNSSTLSNFRNIYHLPSTKVLGYKDVFYTNEQAEKIMYYYKHPDVRPKADYAVSQKHPRKQKLGNEYEAEFIHYFKSLNHDDQNRIFNQMWKPDD